MLPSLRYSPNLERVVRRPRARFASPLAVASLFIANTAAAQPVGSSSAAPTETPTATTASEAPAPVAPGPVAPAPVAPAPAAPPACIPNCRSGYVCVEGQCVSACNPACAAGETCMASGECVGSTPAPGTSVPPLAVATAQPAAPPARPGWARGAGIIGLIGGGAGTLLGVLSAANNGDADTAIPLGAAATATFAIAIPVTAIGAGSARRHPDVRGLPGARIAGWIGYGLTVADALVLLGMGLADEEVPTGVILSVVGLGAATSAAMALDAFASASQAETLAERQSGKLLPLVVAAPDGQGSVAGFVGLGGTF